MVAQDQIGKSGGYARIDYRDHAMSAYADLQETEFATVDEGYSAVRHQQEVGTGYFDEVARLLSGKLSSTLALDDSTESEQF